MLTPVLESVSMQSSIQGERGSPPAVSRTGWEPLFRIRIRETTVWWVQEHRGERVTGEGSYSGRVVEGMKGRRYGRVGR